MNWFDIILISFTGLNLLCLTIYVFFEPKQFSPIYLYEEIRIKDNKSIFFTISIIIICYAFLIVLGGIFLFPEFKKIYDETQFKKNMEKEKRKKMFKILNELGFKSRLIELPQLQKVSNKKQSDFITTMFFYEVCDFLFNKFGILICLDFYDPDENKLYLAAEVVKSKYIKSVGKERWDNADTLDVDGIYTNMDKPDYIHLISSEIINLRKQKWI